MRLSGVVKFDGLYFHRLDLPPVSLRHLVQLPLEVAKHELEFIDLRSVPADGALEALRLQDLKLEFCLYFGQGLLQLGKLDRQGF